MTKLKPPWLMETIFSVVSTIFSHQKMTTMERKGKAKPSAGNEVPDYSTLQKPAIWRRLQEWRWLHPFHPVEMQGIPQKIWQFGTENEVHVFHVQVNHRKPMKTIYQGGIFYTLVLQIPSEKVFRRQKTSPNTASVPVEPEL